MAAYYFRRYASVSLQNWGPNCAAKYTDKSLYYGKLNSSKNVQIREDIDFYLLRYLILQPLKHIFYDIFPHFLANCGICGNFNNNYSSSPTTTSNTSNNNNNDNNNSAFNNLENRLQI